MAEPSDAEYDIRMDTAAFSKRRGVSPDKAGKRIAEEIRPEPGADRPAVEPRSGS
jgi:hypothetical protein